MKLIFQKGLCPLWQMVSSSFYPTEGPYFSYSVPLIMQHTHTRSAVRGYKECRPQKYLSFRGISFALASHGEICGTVLCTQSCPTLGNPMDYSLLDSSVHGIFQARILEWVAISSSRGIFLTQGSTWWLLGLLQVDSLPLSHLGSPKIWGGPGIFLLLSCAFRNHLQWLSNTNLGVRWVGMASHPGLPNFPRHRSVLRLRVIEEAQDRGRTGCWFFSLLRPESCSKTSWSTLSISPSWHGFRLSLSSVAALLAQRLRDPRGGSLYNPSSSRGGGRVEF